MTTRRISTNVVLGILFAFLLAGPLRGVSATVRSLVTPTAASAAQAPFDASEEDRSEDGKDPAAAKIAAVNDALAFLHQRVEVRATHAHVLAAHSPQISQTPLALRWRSTDDRAPRGPPRGDVPARAPPFS